MASEPNEVLTDRDDSESSDVLSDPGDLDYNPSMEELRLASKDAVDICNPPLARIAEERATEKELVYCGVLPFPEKSDSSCDMWCLEWFSHPKLEKDRNIQDILACSGSGGLYILVREQRDEEKAQDAELEWTIMNHFPDTEARILRWQRSRTRMRLAAACVVRGDSDDRWEIKMLRYSPASKKFVWEGADAIFKARIGEVITSLSWSSGDYLLVTDSSKRGVWTIKWAPKRNVPEDKDTRWWPGNYVQRVLGDGPFTGVFHPIAIIFFLGSPNDHIKSYVELSATGRKDYNLFTGSRSSVRPGQGGDDIKGDTEFSFNTTGEWLATSRSIRGDASVRIWYFELHSQDLTLNTTIINPYDRPTPPITRWICEALTPTIITMDDSIDSIQIFIPYDDETNEGVERDEKLMKWKRLDFDQSKIIHPKLNKNFSLICFNPRRTAYFACWARGLIQIWGIKGLQASTTSTSNLPFLEKDREIFANLDDAQKKYTAKANEVFDQMLAGANWLRRSDQRLIVITGMLKALLVRLYRNDEIPRIDMVDRLERITLVAMDDSETTEQYGVYTEEDVGTPADT